MFATLHSHADRICLIDASGRPFTYGEIEALGRKAMGGNDGERQLLFLEGRNTPAFIAAYVAAIAAGQPVHVLDPNRVQDNQRLIARYRPHALVRTDGIWPVREELNRAPLDMAPDLALLLSTSGTTGTSRFAMISRDNIASNTAAIIDYLGLSAEDRTITTLKPFYSFGLSVLNTHLAVGGSIVLSDDSLQTPGFWESARRHEISNFASVPHGFELLAGAEGRLSTLGKLRFLAQAGGRLSPRLVRHFAQLGQAQGWRFFVMYGQTEASPRISYLPPELAADFPQSIGIAIPGGKLWIADENGRDISESGEAGELIYAGPNVMMGYAETAEGLAGGERPERLATGDMAVRLPNGLFVIQGRKSRFVKPFGLRLGLDEIEDLLKEQGLDAAATARGETVVLFVVDTPSGPAARTLSRQIALHYGLPAELFDVRLVDAIPRLANDKVDYRTLACWAQDELGPAFSSSSFWSEVKREFLSILRGCGGSATCVRDIFEDHFALRPIAPSDSFLSLGGDSMAAVNFALQLEDLLGALPDDWAELNLAQLEQLRESVHG